MIPLKCDSIKMTSTYGDRTIKVNGKVQTGFHHGIDIIPLLNGKKDNNAEVLAFASGTVTAVQKTGVQYGQACLVRVKHDNGLFSLYYHLKSESIVVNVGDKVEKGQFLGIIGTTGNSTGIHLHFQIDKGNSQSSINPYSYLFNGAEIEDAKSEPVKEDSELLDLVRRTIKGDFGNGNRRKELLGKRYTEVQKQVNKNLKDGNTQWAKIHLY